VKTQVEAVKNIKIDKITVWDGQNADGRTNTANFISGMMKSVPPLNDLFNMAGMELPSYLKGPEKAPADNPSVEPDSDTQHN
jgi:flotillin